MLGCNGRDRGIYPTAKAGLLPSGATVASRLLSSQNAQGAAHVALWAIRAFARRVNQRGKHGKDHRQRWFCVLARTEQLERHQLANGDAERENDADANREGDQGR